jgi:hypothetical protein
LDSGDVVIQEETTAEEVDEEGAEEDAEEVPAESNGKLSMSERLEKMKELRSRMVSHSSGATLPTIRYPRLIFRTNHLLPTDVTSLRIIRNPKSLLKSSLDLKNNVN